MRYTNTSVTSPSRYVTSSSMWPLHTPMKAISGGGGLQSLLTSDGKRGSEQTLSLGDDSGYYVIAHVFKTFVLLVIISTAMFGNALVIVSVLRTSKLRCVANAFLVSLAFADLLVALLVMTFSASQEILGRWLWGRLACDVFNANDILFSTASLLHLCCISIDRYIAIMDPFHYAARVTVKRVAQMLGVTWTVSALVSHIPVHMGWYTVTSVNGTVDVLVPTSDGSVKCIYMANKTYCLVSSAISFWTPAVVMVVIYVQIYREAERQKTNISRLALGLTASFMYRKGKAGKNKRQAFAVLSSSKARLVGTSQPHVEVKALASDQSKLHGVRNASPEDGARSTDLLPKVRSTPILRHDVDDDNTCIVVDSARTIVECTDNAELAQILPSYDSDATVDFCTTKQNSSRRCKSTGGAGHARGVSQSAEGGRPATTKAGSTKNKPNGSLIAQSTTRNASLRSVRSEHKAAKTLGIIMGGFLCCWLPFFLWYATVTLCDSCVTPSVLVSALFWIGYANSAVNPAVYALHNRDFRLAFLRQLGCSRLLQKRRERRQAAALYD